MAEIVNLRRFRKRQAREAADKQAAENRVSYGTAKTLKDLHDARREQADRRLEGHRRENGGDADE